MSVFLKKHFIFEALNIGSFMNFQYFILLRDAVDPEHIPRSLGMRQEYTLDKMPIYHWPLFTHIHM